jgi:outer membrane receptor protein involved in Fe transport
MRTTTLLICAGLAGTPLLAAEVTPGTGGETLQYAADWYARFTPRSALDMVRQTPGFTLIEGEERRGLAGGVGNVLVDGRRPVAKDQKLEEILGHIPASQVQSIEILRGVMTAGDASGQSVLLNVVRTPFTGQGFGSTGFEYAPGNDPMPNAVLAWTGRARTVDYSLGASTYSFERDLPGSRRLTDADGEASGRRRDVSPRDYGEYALSGEAAMDVAAGRIRMTGKASYSRYHEDSAVEHFDVNEELTGSDLNPYTESKRGGEFGARFDRGIGQWDFNGELLLTRGRFQSDITSTHRTAEGTVGSVFAQQELRESGESILRGTMARDAGPRHRIEVGVEGAINTLDANLALTFDFGGGPFDVPVRNANVAITEKRTDAFFNHAWRFDERWMLSSRLGGEFSRLEFTGDTNQVVELAYFKPSLQLTRDFGKSNQWRIRAGRDVGQLEFADFTSSVSLTDERVEGGNPDLRPQTQWSLEVATDLRPSDKVAVTLAAFHRWVSDTADFTPVGPSDDLEDAPGNIGDARIHGVHVTARAPVPAVRGANLSVDATWQRSRVTDPLTLRSRAISEFQDFEISAAFRQDLAKFAWGISYTEKSDTRSFLLREIDRNRKSPSLAVFTELALWRGLRLKIAAESLLGQHEWRERLLFDPDRRADTFNAERSRRRPGAWYQLFLSGSF